MATIATDRGSLDHHPEDFTVEALAAVLPQEWIREAVAECCAPVTCTRKLPLVLTAWAVILLGLFRRHSYVNLLEMLKSCGEARGLWRGQAPPESSALSRARDRLGVAPLARMYERSATAWTEATDGRRFHGLRVLAMDGSCGRVPDSPLNDAYFGRPGVSRGRAGYPQMRLVLLEDVGTRIERGVEFGPYKVGEVTLARRLVPRIPAPSLVLIDRLYIAYDLLYDLHARGTHFIIRARRDLAYRVRRALGPGDVLVEVDLPRHWRRTRPDLPHTWTLREIRFTPPNAKEEIILLTDLLPDGAPAGQVGDTKEIAASEIAAEFSNRWDAETTNAEVKNRLGDIATVTRPTLLRSKTPDRIAQEIYGLLIAHNAVRYTMALAAKRRPDSPSPHRLSYTLCVERTRDAVRDMMQLPTQRLAERHDRLLESMARMLVPWRPGRHYPRAVKVKMSKYPLKPAKTTG